MKLPFIPSWDNDIKRSEQAAALVLALIVFLVGFSLSSMFAKSVADQNTRDFKTRIEQRSLSIKTYAEDRLNSYNLVLFAAASVYNINQRQLTYEQWQKFYRDNNIGDQFPSLLGLGFTKVLGADEVAGYEQAMRQAGREGFTITPVGSRDIYTAISYLEPADKYNTRAIGFDMFSESTRRKAMETARDESRVAMTAPVSLVQDGGDDDGNDLQGVLLYYPVYRGGHTPTTIAERQAAIDGYVYIAVRPSDILTRYLERSKGFDSSGLTITLADVSSDETRMFVLDNSPAEAKNKKEATNDMVIDDRVWRITVAGQDVALNTIFGPGSLFTLGGVVSGLLGMMTYFVLHRRVSRVAEIYEGEVEKSKDELLALASHQLRTPASGVKQYIGILREGIMGNLTPAQQTIIEKAYETNERQIHIINDMLYVSKADAGQLMIEPVDTDVTRLVREVIDDIESDAAQKEITLVFSRQRPAKIIADERFLAMIIENVVSNAVKYSYPQSTVRITLHDRRDYYLLKVFDKGVGIAEQDTERIFDKFERSDNPLSYVEGGSGLGLFLARALARAHGGDLSVDSTEGKGSTFTIRMPKKASTERSYVNLSRRSS